MESTYTITTYTPINQSPNLEPSPKDQTFTSFVSTATKKIISKAEGKIEETFQNVFTKRTDVEKLELELKKLKFTKQADAEKFEEKAKSTATLQNKAIRLLTTAYANLKQLNETLFTFYKKTQAMHFSSHPSVTSTSHPLDQGVAVLKNIVNYYLHKEPIQTISFDSEPISSTPFEGELESSLTAQAAKRNKEQLLKICSQLDKVENDQALRNHIYQDSCFENIDKAIFEPNNKMQKDQFSVCQKIIQNLETIVLRNLEKLNGVQELVQGKPLYTVYINITALDKLKSQYPYVPLPILVKKNEFDQDHYKAQKSIGEYEKSFEMLKIMDQSIKELSQKIEEMQKRKEFFEKQELAKQPYKVVPYNPSAPDFDQ
ncbi:MAG: hypothetical protein BGO10_04975 [Chlamydia sp. 32-24]|nr:MAG: hypothetical protein BGO10_04975 [Chlamydia sp. 32-24]